MIFVHFGEAEQAKKTLIYYQLVKLLQPMCLKIFPYLHIKQTWSISIHAESCFSVHLTNKKSITVFFLALFWSPLIPEGNTWLFSYSAMFTS